MYKSLFLRVVVISVVLAIPSLGVAQRTSSIPSSSVDQADGLTVDGKSPKRPVRCSIELQAQQSFAANKPIVIDVTVKNLSDEELPWTPSGSGRDLRITVRSGFVEAKRTALHRRMRGEALAEGEFVSSGSSFTAFIMPGQSAKQSVDLKDLYDLEPGVYTVVAQRYDSTSDVFVRSNVLNIQIR